MDSTFDSLSFVLHFQSGTTPLATPPLSATGYSLFALTRKGSGTGIDAGQPPPSTIDLKAR